jgi:hypothetical protein
MYISKKKKRSFGDAETFLKQSVPNSPNWKKWQKAWKNHIANYTSCVKPESSDVEIRGISEEFDPKKACGTSQIKTINFSRIFGQDITLP